MDELLALVRAEVDTTRAERGKLSDASQKAFAALARWLAEHDKANESCPGNAAQE